MLFEVVHRHESQKQSATYASDSSSGSTLRKPFVTGWPRHWHVRRGWRAARCRGEVNMDKHILSHAGWECTHAWCTASTRLTSCPDRISTRTRCTCWRTEGRGVGTAMLQEFICLALREGKKSQNRVCCSMQAEQRTRSSAPTATRAHQDACDGYNSLH